MRNIVKLSACLAACVIMNSCSYRKPQSTNKSTSTEDAKFSCSTDLPKSFVSIQKLETGLGPDGAIKDYWTLRFTFPDSQSKKGIFEWSHSDADTAGTIECEDDGSIATTVSGVTRKIGKFDIATGTLQWDNEIYVRNQELSVDSCNFIPARKFVSVEKLESGLGPNGMILGRWSVTFHASDFLFQFSDATLSGKYTCNNKIIKARYSNGKPVDVILDDRTLVLHWEGKAYVEPFFSDDDGQGGQEHGNAGQTPSR